MSAASDSPDSYDTPRSATGLSPAVQPSVSPPDTVPDFLPHSHALLPAPEEALVAPAAPWEFPPEPVLGAGGGSAESRTTEANTEVAVAALETARAEGVWESGAVRCCGGVGDLNAVGGPARFPKEVASIADALPGIDLAEVNRIWENKFDPLNLVKLYPGNLGGCSTSDIPDPASDEMESRRPKGEFRDYPDLSTLLYYWSIYQFIVIHLFGSRNHQIGGLMSLHANRLIERDRTHQWEAVLHYHIAFHRQAIRVGIYNPAFWQSDDQSLVSTFFQAHTLRTSAPEDSFRNSQEGLNFSIRLLRRVLDLLLNIYCLLFLSPLFGFVAVMETLGIGTGAPTNAQAERPGRGGWSITVAIEKKPKVPPKPEPRGGETHGDSSDEDSDGDSSTSSAVAATGIKPKKGPILKIYTDGSSLGNGRASARGGIGVWFGDGDPRNISEPLTGLQTNRRAELMAILRAIDTAPMHRDVAIFTDSQYSINCVTAWHINWARNGWRYKWGNPVKSQDLIKEILKKMKEREKHGSETLFKWVKGHTGENDGNSKADKLANKGARMKRVASDRQ